MIAAWLRGAIALLVLATILAGASVLAQGPLPGDVALTRALQAWLPAGGWAPAVTATAKQPWVWATLMLSGALAWALARGPGLWVLLTSFAIVKGLDALLRALLYTPKPDPDLVFVAQASSSSGFPSSFMFVYGACFGAVLLLAVAARSRPGAALAVLAAACLLAGGLARIVLGGHWPSQVLASLALALAVALACRALLRRA